MARRSMAVADIKEILVQWDAGETLSRIARSLGYTRPTVRKYVGVAQRLGLSPGSRRRDEAEWERLAQAALRQAAQQPPPGAAAQEVAHYHDYLAERVGQVRLSVLHQRLRDEQGLRASWGTFYRYARKYWPDQVRPGPTPTVRLADPPAGEEAQVDFFYVGRWTDPEAERQRRLYGFLMTLSHSRHQFLYPVLAEDSVAWLEGHIQAFQFFGGAPRRVVPDNLTAGIVQAHRYDPRLNRAYGELTRYYGCLVDPARVRRPTDKPRVERDVSYARESFFRGRDFAGLGEMRQAAVRWCREVAGQRVHGTTGEQPWPAFQAREQAALLPLPPRPWEPVLWTTAKVQRDCHLTVAKVAYSVPYRYVGQTLDVRLGPTTVEIYQGAELVTSHLRATQGPATRPEHYPKGAQAFLRATPQVCLEQAQAIGPATAALVQPLLATTARHHLREVQTLLRLQERYGSERLELACGRALEAGDGRLRTVRGLLERDLEQQPPTTEHTAAGAESVGRAFLRGPAELLAPVTEPGS